jgi:F-type H+-transporting ATPase subunit a
VFINKQSLILYKDNLYIKSPLDIFELINLLSVQGKNITNQLYYFSNLNFIIIIFIALFIYFFFVINYYNSIIFNNLSIFYYSIFDKVKEIIRETLNKENNIYFLFILTLFTLLLLCNLLGLLPYGLSIISYLTITFTISFIFFIGFNITSIKTNLLNYLTLFLPHGTPTLLAPFIILIEFISYFTRMFSLAIRLFANIIAGHTLLKILNSFTWTMITDNSIWAILFILPFTIICLIMGLETIIALLQAYVFIVLLLIYLKDTLYLH